MLEALEWCKRLLRATLASAETRRIKRIRAQNWKPLESRSRRCLPTSNEHSRRYYNGMHNSGHTSKKLTRMLGGSGLAQSKPVAVYSQEVALVHCSKELPRFQERTKEETPCTTL
jgi:hypothetical protein